MRGFREQTTVSAALALLEQRVSPLGNETVLSSTTRADGVVIVDEAASGYAIGAIVDVLLY